ncbi:MAG: 23S rRNA (guanosine(2251)-2'-O)-methyltransferase RlmB [Gammaproteobacteria bacterium]|nr:23S rRNA (guanosine(2251)-2'-O)-methyltransferase RlmB [Gammaproteobacteria bacterium]
MNSQKYQICFGIHSVMAKLQLLGSVYTLYLSESSSSPRLSGLEKLAIEQNIPVIRCAKAKLDEISGYGLHQGVVAEYVSTSVNQITTIKQVIQGIDSGNALILILDHLQDPHNLGACLRTAESAGVNAVIMPKHSACPVNQTVIKVASGAVETLSIILVSNIVNAMKLLKKKGFWVYGTSDRGVNELYKIGFHGRVALVIGNEGQGMKRLTAEACDMEIRIPLFGQVESLNASVATGVCLFEIRRQFGKIENNTL